MNYYKYFKLLVFVIAQSSLTILIIYCAINKM